MTRTYCYKCTGCEARLESDQYRLTYCSECECFDCLIRDYKAESVALSIENLKSARQ